jgi:cell pole-organizing protein PopZ
MTAAGGDSPEKDQSMDDILASIRRIMLDEQARLQDSPVASQSSHAAARQPGGDADPVLILDSSMVVEDEPHETLAVTRAEETVIMVFVETGPAVADRASPDRVELDRVELDRVELERAPDAGHAIMTEMVPRDAAAVDGPILVAPAPDGSAQMTVPGAAVAAPVHSDITAQQIAFTSQAIEALLAPAAAAAAAASMEALLKQLGEERLAVRHPSPPPSPSIEEVVRTELRPFLKTWLDEHLPSMVERLIRAEITRLIGRSGF